MTLENTLAAVEATPEPNWEALNDLPTTSEPAETTEPAPAEEPAQDTPAPSEPEPTPDDEVARLRRVIAMDPNLRAAYEADKFGIQYAQQQPQYTPPVQPQQPQPVTEPVKPQSIEEAFAQTFPGEEYNPYDLRHTTFQAEFVHERKLAPFAEFIEQQKQEEILQQKAQFKAYIDQLDQGLNQLMDKDLPGFSQWTQGQSDEHRFVVKAAEDKFAQAMYTAYPPNQMRNGQPYNPLWEHPRVHQEVVKQIAPAVKTLATKLGLVTAKLSKQVDPKLAADMGVVSTNAVPTQSGNAFDKAFKTGDVAQMFAALG